MTQPQALPLICPRIRGLLLHERKHALLQVADFFQQKPGMAGHLVADKGGQEGGLVNQASRGHVVQGAQHHLPGFTTVFVFIGQGRQEFG